MNATKRALVGGLIVVAALLASGGGAGAASPRIVTSTVDVSVVDPYFTQLCGFEVRFFNVGTLNSTLFVDAAGTIVREVDTTQGDVAGWSSPASGRSIVFRTAQRSSPGIRVERHPAVPRS